MTAAHAVQLLGILAMLAVAAANRRLARQVDAFGRQVNGLSNEVARLRGLVRSSAGRPARGSASAETVKANDPDDVRIEFHNTPPE